MKSIDFNVKDASNFVVYYTLFQNLKTKKRWNDLSVWKAFEGDYHHIYIKKYSSTHKKANRNSKISEKMLISEE